MILLDLIEHLCKNSPDKFSAEPKIEFRQQLTEGELKKEFREGQIKNGLPRQHWANNGIRFLNLFMRWEIDSYFNNVEIIDVEGYETELIDEKMEAERFKRLETVGKQKSVLLRSKIFRRVLADRDIILEPKSEKMELGENGLGATNIIQRFITHSKYDRNVVQLSLLSALNLIFEPDAKFTEIQVQMYDGRSFSDQSINSVYGINTTEEDIPDRWEVYLGEERKGLIALSKSGSGLKTVILVLLNLIVMPILEKKTVGEFIYAFEELENNLHPTLLRRLHKYLLDFAVENNCHIFLTTHSNVAIDQFAGNDNSQIVHVRHDGEKATAETIDSHIGRTELLDDLGAKASDILQSNGLVWLEGPSDRIYFNKWIEIFSDGKLKEGRDYECVFYGGSSLASFEAKDSLDEETLKEKINIMKINRNAILIGDSDKTSKRMKLKGRLAQIKPQMEKVGAYIWITKAKEIENYIPVEALRAHYKKETLPAIEQYQQFSYYPKSKKTQSARSKPKGYLQQNLGKKDDRYDKVELARNIIKHFTEENLGVNIELKEEMINIIHEIKNWNEL